MVNSIQSLISFCLFAILFEISISHPSLVQTFLFPKITFHSLSNKLKVNDTKRNKSAFFENIQGEITT